MAGASVMRWRRRGVWCFFGCDSARASRLADGPGSNSEPEIELSKSRHTPAPIVRIFQPYWGDGTCGLVSLGICRPGYPQRIIPEDYPSCESYFVASTIR